MRRDTQTHTDTHTHRERESERERERDIMWPGWCAISPCGMKLIVADGSTRIMPWPSARSHGSAISVTSRLKVPTAVP